MARALVVKTTGRVAQIVSSEEEEFPVASGLEWRDAPPEVTDRHVWDRASGFSLPTPEPPVLSPSQERIAQLKDLILTAIAAGRPVLGNLRTELGALLDEEERG